MSLPELAKVSGISRGHLSDIERGRVVMTMRTLAALAVGLQVPPFLICLVPKDDPQILVVDLVLEAARGDIKEAAKDLRELIFEIDRKIRRRSS